MAILLQTVGLLAGAALLYFGADFLVRGGSSLARRAGVSPLLIGLTLVAFGTSAPELVVSSIAAWQGHGDIAVGNVAGSNICNIALILGLCALLKPVEVDRKLFRLDLPAMVLATVLFIAQFLLCSRQISRLWGAAYLIICALYLWRSCQLNRSDYTDAAAEEETVWGKWAALAAVVGGLLALAGGARLFVNGAVFFARLAGVSEAVISLSVVALGTSLPELATSVVAVLKNQKEIAIGNIIGSNLFNILVILGIAPLVRPLAAPGILNMDLIFMVLAAVLLWPLLRFRYRLSRAGGLFYLLFYAFYIVLIFLRKP